jgi:uncharacterized protein YcaQ
MKSDRARPHLDAMRKEKVLLPLEGILWSGKSIPLLIHRDLLPLLEQAARGTMKLERTTFLNPFDNFFWARGRDLVLWGFRQALEVYKLAAKRIWGYYCLPILHRDRLVGRFDPQLKREDGEGSRDRTKRSP